MAKVSLPKVKNKNNEGIIMTVEEEETKRRKKQSWL